MNASLSAKYRRKKHCTYIVTDSVRIVKGV